MAAPHAPVAALAEVVVTLGGTILDVRHVGRARGRTAPWSPWLPRYTVGEGAQAHLPVALAAGPGGCFTLVEATAAGILVGLAPEMTGTITRGGAAETVAAARARGEATLVPGDAATLTIGAVQVAIRVEAATPVQRFRAPLDRPMWLSQAGALALFAALMFVVQRAAPVAEAPRFDDPEVQAKLIRYLTPAQDDETSAPVKPQVAPRASRTTAAAPPAARATGGSITAIVRELRGGGATDSARRAGIFGIAEFMAALEQAGKDADASRQRYAAFARDDAPFAAAAAKAPPSTIAGLTLAETERGGGGDARGVFDLDLAWLLPPKKVDPAKLRARAEKERWVAREAGRGQPEVRQNVAWTSSVGRDLIRGVVNRHKPDVRQCFREGRERNPGLAGDVEVAFTIQGDGAVAYASIARSTLADRDVEGCVTAAVKRWKFPVFVASGGDVDVRFPFTVGAA